jgi:hypothetical protein
MQLVSCWNSWVAIERTPVTIAADRTLTTRAAPGHTASLSLDDELVSALTDLHKLQTKASENAGTDYRDGIEDFDWYVSGDEWLP